MRDIAEKPAKPRSGPTLFGLLSAASIASMTSLGAFAQEQDPEQEKEAKSRYAIEEIVVTARRTEEGLQDAPLAVTALSAADLENRSAVDVIDFADVAPNVNFKAGGNISGFGAAPVVTIRGVGQSDFVINTDPAVGIYTCLLYTSPSPRDQRGSRMPSSA